MSTVASIASWPAETGSAALDGVGGETLLIDLRQDTEQEHELEALRGLARWCLAETAARTGAAALTVLVRHNRSGSGRTSSTLFGEVALNAVRGFFRQLRYDRNWLSTPIAFVDAGDAGDAEVVALANALVTGPSRMEVDKSSGETLAAHWKHREGL
jgi:hypothetical protein